MFLDMHSHILPNVDDGAKTLQNALDLLEMLKEQGVTDVLASSHFYPFKDNLDEFSVRYNASFESLSKIAKERNLPNLYKACEFFYFKGMSRIENINDFTINNTNYILIEIGAGHITNDFFEELLFLRDKRNIIPIIAHIERYCKFKNYKNLIEFVKKEKIQTQINCDSFFFFSTRKALKKLFELGIVNYIASDTHSPDTRPPLFDKAFKYIEKKYSKNTTEMLKNNSVAFLKNLRKVTVDEF